MSLKPRPVSHGYLGSLTSCLVEGDPEQQLRERRIRRRALLISVVLQSVVLAVLVLVPLFGKPDHIAASIVELPPYHHPGNPQHRTENARHFRPRPVRDSTLYQPTAISQHIETQVPAAPSDIDDRWFSDGPNVPGMPDLAPVNGPQPPLPATPHADQPQTVHFSSINPAMLIHRVEPVYPTLARQTGRSGRVELRAIIDTDGTIHSLQAVSGDPLFFPSALDAVRQWQYRPTVLNGEKVKVDTFITVIYLSNR